jgi:acyl-CoA thioester hydrolase
MISAEVEIEVPFHDVDLMGVVWHGHYLKYFEIARCALLNKFDYNYMQMLASGYVWPVIDSHVRYIGAIRFEQKIIVKATLKEWENRLKIDYLITDVLTGKRLTKGHSIQVAVDGVSYEMSLQSPDILREKLIQCGVISDTE